MCPDTIIMFPYAVTDESKLWWSTVHLSCCDQSFHLWVICFPSSQRTRPHSWKHSVISGCDVTVFCRTGVQGMVPSHIRWNAVEEAYWTESQDWSFVERVVRTEGMVSFSQHTTFSGQYWNKHWTLPQGALEMLFEPCFFSINNAIP